MRYNENDGDEVNGKVIITSEIDDNPIFEISCVVAGDISVDTLHANYDLTIIGSIRADKIDVAGNFSCYGECDCEEIAIQGACFIDGNLSVETGFIGDSLNAKEICADSLEVKGTVICLNMECNDEVICEKSVLIAEGLTGSGSLSSKMTLCGEYSLIDDATNLIVADSIEAKSPINEDDSSSQVYKASDEEEALEDIKEKARTITAQKFSDELSRYVDKYDKYKREYEAFRKLMLVENITTFPSLKTYVDIIDVVNKKYQIISFTKLFGKVKARFESFDYDDVNHSVMSSITQKEFAKMLYILTYREQSFDSKIRDLIIDTLFAYSGIDSKVFQIKHNKDSANNIVKEEVKEKTGAVAKNTEKEEIRENDSIFKIGDEITVSNGVWKYTSGVVHEVDNKKKIIVIHVDLFGRETPVQIAFADAVKTNS